MVRKIWYFFITNIFFIPVNWVSGLIQYTFHFYCSVWFLFISVGTFFDSPLFLLLNLEKSFKISSYCYTHLWWRPPSGHPAYSVLGSDSMVCFCRFLPHVAHSLFCDFWLWDHILLDFIYGISLRSKFTLERICIYFCVFGVTVCSRPVCAGLASWGLAGHTWKENSGLRCGQPVVMTSQRCCFLL